MTEQEAIKALKLEGGIEITGRAKRCADFCMGLDIAIKALEEVQRYRSMDERLSAAYGENNGLLETLVEYTMKWKSENKAGEMPAKTIMLTDEDVDRWKAYREIGTVEECREAVERQKAKKPTIGADFMVRRDDNGEPIWQHHYIDYICHECGLGIAEEYICCPYCGTYIDWSEEKDGNQ